MSDGIRLAATPYLPGGEGTWPSWRLSSAAKTISPPRTAEYVRRAEAGYVVCRWTSAAPGPRRAGLQ
ncbi:MAG: hypothetical protein ACRDHK_13525 [Actinomycetota bacterium]